MGVRTGVVKGKREVVELVKLGTASIHTVTVTSNRTPISTQAGTISAETPTGTPPFGAIQRTGARDGSIATR